MNQTPEQAADAFVKKLRKEMSNRSLLNRPIVHQELEGIAHEAFMEGIKYVADILIDEKQIAWPCCKETIEDIEDRLKPKQR